MTPVAHGIAGTITPNAANPAPPGGFGNLRALDRRAKNTAWANLVTWFGEQLRSPDREDLRVRPCDSWDKVRFYFGYLVSAWILVLARRMAKSPGYFIPGMSKLKVSVASTLFYARPRTDDLDMLAASYEPRTARWFKTRPGDVVVDAGSHIGRYALVAARTADRVVAIEPDPSNFSMLKGNISLNRFSNVTSLQVALSRRRGRFKLYLGERGDTSTSSLEPGWMTPNRRTIEVKCERLDDLLRPLRLESIDWLKIDVEGHEVAVLEGAHSALRRTMNLILEVSSDHEDACRALAEKAGLSLVSIEKRMGGLISNWLMLRSG